MGISVSAFLLTFYRLQCHQSPAALATKNLGGRFLCRWPDWRLSPFAQHTHTHTHTHKRRLSGACIFPRCAARRVEAGGACVGVQFPASTRVPDLFLWSGRSTADRQRVPVVKDGPAAFGILPPRPSCARASLLADNSCGTVFPSSDYFLYATGGLTFLLPSWCRAKLVFFLSVTLTEGRNGRRPRSPMAAVLPACPELAVGSKLQVAGI